MGVVEDHERVLVHGRDARQIEFFEVGHGGDEADGSVGEVRTPPEVEFGEGRKGRRDFGEDLVAEPVAVEEVERAQGQAVFALPLNEVVPDVAEEVVVEMAAEAERQMFYPIHAREHAIEYVRVEHAQATPELIEEERAASMPPRIPPASMDH